MAKATTFRRLVREISEARTEEELTAVMYSRTGIDQSYQREEITWEELEMLFTLAGRLITENQKRQEE